jgi:hypothetical protein
MDDTPDLSAISKLQFHYWLSDKTHSMDALVYNKCEREVLEIARMVAKLCGVSIVMETEPSGKGGIKSWLTLTAKSPKKTAHEKIALVNVLVAASIVSGGNVQSEPLLINVIDNLFADQNVDAGQQGLGFEQMVRLKGEAVSMLSQIEQNGTIKKRRSNFYQLVSKYHKVKGISVVITDTAKKPITKEQLISRDRFNAFKVSSGSTLTYILESAVVDIISPVLVTGKHKWKGIYNNKSISFTMKSDEFLSMVQSGRVEFKSGSSINCRLEVEKKINSAGIEKVTGYNIIGVASYSENGKTTETPETKQKQKENVVNKKQLDLFG